MPTLTDAGPLISLIDGKDYSHSVCRATLPMLESPMVTPWPCYTEAMCFLGKSIGFADQKALWRLRSSGLLMLKETTPEELVIAAQTLRLMKVFTLDRHFYAYRLADGSALEVVP